MAPHHFRGNIQDHLRDILGEEIFSGKDEAPDTVKFPKVNLYEFKEKFVIIAQLPGLNDPSQINISMMGSSLILSGIIDQPHRTEGIKLLVSECFDGAFERKVDLPSAANGVGKVSYTNGLLKIELMKERETNSVNVKVQFS